MPQFYPVLCVAVLAACSDTTISNGRVGGMYGQKDVSVTYTTADLRMVEERTNPLSSDTYRRNIVCTEPAPDVAKALSAAAQGQASGGNGTINVNIGGGFSSTEAVLELAGRSTALLGLRDGLFRTCEAYANGAIGDAAYSLVLSRYGQLMVALFLAQDIQNAAAAATNSVASPTVSVGGGDANGGSVTPLTEPKPGSDAGKKSNGAANSSRIVGATASTNAKPTPTMVNTSAVGVALRAGQLGQSDLLRRTAFEPNASDQQLAKVGVPAERQPAQDQTSRRQVVSQSDASGSAADGTAINIPLSNGYTLIPRGAASIAEQVERVVAVKPGAKAQGAATSTPNTQTSDGAVNSTSADAIAKIAQGYFDLGVPSVLLVACIDEYDTSRPNYNVAKAEINSFLRGGACDSLKQSLPNLLTTTQTSSTIVSRPKR